MCGMGPADLLKVQQAVAAGRWRENHQAKEWVGVAVSSALDLDADDKHQRAKIKTMVRAWLKSGALVIVDGHDEKRMARSYVEVGEWVSVSPQEIK